ncbi:MAG: FlgD immunoglobulin-like domain containing protein [Rhodothermales bacterium]
MEITSLTPAADTPAGPTTPPTTFGDPSLGKDEFLNLLVAQLRNQDPLNPQEGHEFVAQLAQFSSVEQLANISSTLNTHSGQLAALAEGMSASAAQQAALAGTLTSGMNLSTASALIGQTVEVAGNELGWNGSDPAAFGFELADSAADVEVTVRDAEGNVVRTFALGGQGEGAHNLTWDGRDGDGAPLPEGDYTFEVSAQNADGDDVAATSYIRGTVDRITIESGGVSLWFGGRSVPLSDLRSIVS